MMTSIEKIWREGSDEFKVIFYYDPAQTAIIPDFEIEVSPLEYGDYDPNELNFFPSNLTITLSGGFGHNYEPFKTLLSLYSKIFPFNFKSVFYTEYYKNGTLKHQGVLADVKYDDKTENIELLIASATKYYENVNMDGYYFLERLAASGIPRKEINYFGVSVYTYGLNNAYIDGDILRPGLVTDSSFRLVDFMEIIFKAVNPDCNFTVDNDLLFGTTADTCDKTIHDLFITNIFTNYLGRYAIVSGPGRPQFTEAWEYLDNNLYTQVFRYIEDQAVQDKNLIPVIRNIFYNFFSRGSWNSFDDITMVKKYSLNPDDAILITDDDIVFPQYKKNTFIPLINYVKVNDVFSGRSAERGTNASGLEDADKLEYSINFSGFIDGALTGYSLFYKVGSDNFPVLFMKDPVTGYVNSVPETLAQLEWDHRRYWRDKIPMTLWGTEWRFDKTYKFRNEVNRVVLLRPMKMSVDEKTNTTSVEFIDITP